MKLPPPCFKGGVLQFEKDFYFCVNKNENTCRLFFYWGNFAHMLLPYTAITNIVTVTVFSFFC